MYVYLRWWGWGAAPITHTLFLPFSLLWHAKTDQSVEEVAQSNRTPISVPKEVVCLEEKIDRLAHSGSPRIVQFLATSGKPCLSKRTRR